MTNITTPEQLCRRFARELRAALRAADRHYLRYGETLDDLRITIGVRQADETADDSADLPELLRIARPATRAVYRILRELRDQLSAEARVTPTHIAEAIRQRGDIPSMDTIHHSLRDLRDRELAWSHPQRGWVLGCEQPRLPTFAGQSDRPFTPELREYASRMADAGVRRFQRGGLTVTKSYIWVPGESGDYGLVVIDAVTEESVPPTDHVEHMTYETPTGRRRTVLATRGELVRVEGKLAVVRLGKHEIHTRILGDWQLRGLLAPEPESCEVA